MKRNQATTGTFVTRKKTQEAHIVDCSTWIDTEAEEWTEGNFESRQQEPQSVTTEDIRAIKDLINRFGHDQLSNIIDRMAK